MDSRECEMAVLQIKHEANELESSYDGQLQEGKSYELQIPFQLKSEEMKSTETSFDVNVALVDQKGPHLSYICKACKNSFNSKSKLDQHMETDHKEVKFKCNHCSRQFNRQELLEQHLLIHLKNKSFTCPVLSCQKSFNTKGLLAQHQLTHQDAKIFDCEICFKSFSTAMVMQQHLRSQHLKDRPYVCNVNGCEKSFSQKSNLAQHQRYHFGDKSYRCVYCPKEFFQKSNLDQHIRTHTKEKPYSCIICNKCFSQKSNLDQHIRYHHTQDKPYECDSCGERFIQQTSLNYHIKKTHLRP